MAAVRGCWVWAGLGLCGLQPRALVVAALSDDVDSRSLCVWDARMRARLSPSLTYRRFLSCDAQCGAAFEVTSLS